MTPYVLPPQKAIFTNQGWQTCLKSTLSGEAEYLSRDMSIRPSVERVDRGLGARLVGRMVSQFMVLTISIGKVSLRIIALRQCNPLFHLRQNTPECSRIEKNHTCMLKQDAVGSFVAISFIENISSWHHLLPSSLLDKLSIDSDGFLSRKLVCIDLFNRLVIAASFFMSLSIIIIC